MKKKPGLIALLIFLSFAAIYLAFVFVNNKTPVNYAVKIDEFKTRGVPEFKLPLYDLSSKKVGHLVGLSDTHFRVALVNFWATWCLPCKNEFPSLVELSNHYKDNPNVKIFAVSVDVGTDEITAFTKPYHWGPGFEILLDEHFQVANRYGTTKIPETYIISGDHKLLRKVISEQNWTSSEFIEFLDGLLKGSTS